MGFVWVNLDPECDSLEVHLDLIFKMRFGDASNPFRENGIEKLGLARTIDYGTIGANWKLLWENFSECYHCPTLHDSLCNAVPQFASGYGTVTGPQGQGARLADSYEGFSITGTRVGTVLPGLSSSDERMFYGALLWPTGQIVCVSDHATLLCMIPEGPDRTRVIGYWLFQPSDIEDPLFNPDPAVELFDKTNREDFDACARMQKNTTSSHWNLSHVYAPFEYRIRSFRQWVEAAMSAPSITDAYLSAAAQPSGWDDIHHYIGSEQGLKPAGMGETS
ncbi:MULTISPECIES: SRPBCC family protein [unclassified Rhodococcus (in: high G+C Gram-positive bacteria)]|uniref:SRPBCC family protein n=1 Tax=unclassified Rhodococcus (in: high G+C Gram-positive bacteria) TaxID=192944 RepID=UPI00339B6339